MRPQLPLHEVNRVNNESLIDLCYGLLVYCVQLTKICTTEGHVFDQTLAFRLFTRSNNNRGAQRALVETERINFS